MDKPIFQEGQRVAYVEMDGVPHPDTRGKVTRVFSHYTYEVEWDDMDPPWDIYEAGQLTEAD